MKTNFINLSNPPCFEGKETVFLHRVTTTTLDDADSYPGEWENVAFIGKDSVYGDVFKAWDGYPENFTIFFSEKGDEFNS